MSEILDMARDRTRDLVTVGAMDAITMRKLDTLCSPPKRPLTPGDIQRIRSTNPVSQAAFAAVLAIGNTTGPH